MKLVIQVILLLAMALLVGCVTTSDTDSGSSPTDAARYNVQLGLEYLNQGRRDLAMEKLQRAVEQDPRSAEARMALAYAYNHYGDADRADEHYSRALRLDDDNPDVRNTYGAFLCQHGRLQEAERHFLAAARNGEYTTPEVAWTNAGICAEREPDLDKAERYYREALNIDSRHADALWQMAQLAFNRDNALSARGFVQRYLEVAPRSAESMWLGYQVETALDDTVAAQRYARVLRDDFPNSEQARLLQEAERVRGR